MGLVASLLTRGRFRCASQNQLRMEYWLVGGLLVQLLWPWIAASLGVGAWEFLVVWLLVGVLVLGISIVNVKVPGMVLVIVGLLLNLAVVAANGGMPVDVTQVLGDNVVAAQSLAASPLHIPVAEGTSLVILGDILFAPGPSWHQALVSIGDILMAVGAGVVAYWALRCRRKDEPAPSKA